MNSKMFKRVMNQAQISIDNSISENLFLANTIKIFKKNDTYYAYMIDSKLNRTLIAETQSENNLYKAILKYLGIKLNHYGDVKNSDIQKFKR